MASTAKIQGLLGEMGQPRDGSLKEDFGRTQTNSIDIGSMFKQMMAANETAEFKTTDKVTYLAEKSNDMIKKLDSIAQVVIKVKNELDQVKKYEPKTGTDTNEETVEPTMKANKFNVANDSPKNSMVPAANDSKFIDPENKFKDDLAKDPIEVLRVDMVTNFDKVFALLDAQSKTIEETSQSTGEVKEAVNTDEGREKLGFAVKAAIGALIAGAVISGVKSMGETVAEKLVDFTEWAKEKLGYSALETDEDTNKKALASLNKKIASTGYVAMGSGKYKGTDGKIIMAAALPEETKKQFAKLGVKGFEEKTKAAAGGNESYSPLGRLNIPDTAAPLTGLTPETSTGGAGGAMPTMAAPPKKIASESGKKAMITAMDKRGITDPVQRAAIMAQVAHESGGFSQLSENLNYSQSRLQEVFGYYRQNPEEASVDASNPYAIASKAYGNRMGNGPPPTGEGFEYRGRGFIQLTGKANYQRFGISNPDSLLSPEKAADNALDYMLGYGGDWADTAAVTQYVNGGSNGLADRMGYFNQFVSDPSIVGTEAAESGGANMAQSGGGGGGGLPPIQQKAPVQTQTAPPAMEEGMASAGGGGGGAVAGSTSIAGAAGSTGGLTGSAGGDTLASESITKSQTNSLLEIAAQNKAKKEGIGIEQARMALATPATSIADNPPAADISPTDPASIFSGKLQAFRSAQRSMKDAGMIQTIAQKMGIAPNADGGFNAQFSGMGDESFPSMINGASVPRELMGRLSENIPNIPFGVTQSREIPFDNFFTPTSVSSPKPTVDGAKMSSGSKEIEADRASVPPPVIINNQQQSAPQMVMSPESKAPPPTPISTTPMDSAFLRAMSKDFAHPTQFSSSVIV
jgi:putative chitinase